MFFFVRLDSVPIFIQSYPFNKGKSLSLHVFDEDRFFNSKISLFFFLKNVEKISIKGIGIVLCKNLFEKEMGIWYSYSVKINGYECFEEGIVGEVLISFRFSLYESKERYYKKLKNSNEMILSSHNNTLKKNFVISNEGLLRTFNHLREDEKLKETNKNKNGDQAKKKHLTKNKKSSPILSPLLSPTILRKQTVRNRQKPEKEEKVIEQEKEREKKKGLKKKEEEYSKEKKEDQ
jgi:hypothetical protein